MASVPTTLPSNEPKPWRGRRGQLLKRLRYRWQKDWTMRPSRRFRSDGWRRVRVACLIGMVAGLLGLFVYNVLFSPVQTPVIALCATEYAWPFPPNAWAREDVDGLAALDGQNIALTDLTDEWASRERGLAALERERRQIEAAAARSGRLIVYLSVHGMVNGQGVACIAPPDSSPQRAESWMPVTDVLARIKSMNLPDDCHKLVILDCNRQLVNWNLGVLYNGFAEALSAAVAEANDPHLVVFNSTSAGQIGWASSELRGSAFGHFLRRGLAGEADSTALGGDGNRRVSLYELQAYVMRQVNHWTRHNRGASQQPLMLPSDAANFDVTYTLSGRWQRRIAAPVVDEDQQTNSTAGDIAKLWRAHDRLKARRPEHFAPLSWRKVEHQLLWLEQASQAGEAYAAPVRNRLAELQGRLATLDARSTKAGDQNWFASASAFSDQALPRPEKVSPHELVLGQRLGLLPADRAAALATELSALAAKPTLESAEALLARWPKPAGKPDLAEVHQVRELTRYLSAPAWQQPDAIGRAITLQMLARNIASPTDERVWPAITELVTEADIERRAFEDLLLAGDAAGATTHGDEAQQKYRQAEAATQLMQDALARCDAARLQLPYLAAWLARPNLGELNDVTAADDAIGGKLLPLIEDLRLLAESLDAATPILAQPTWNEVAGRVGQEHDEVVKLFYDRCDELAKTKSLAAGLLPEIEMLLATPLVPVGRREELTRALAAARTRLHEEFDSAEAMNNDPNGSKQAHGSEYVQRVVGRWSHHPAVAILVTDQAAAQPPTADESLSETAKLARLRSGNPLRVIAQQGELVRQSLSGLAVRLRQLNDQASAATGANPQVNETRAIRTHAERMARSAASFYFAVDETPIRRRILFDLQQLLIAAADRALENFYGPAGQADIPPFQSAATEYLKAARTLTDASPAVQHQLDELDALLAERQLAARSALRTSAADVVAVGETDQVRFDLGVETGPAPARQGLPAGTATVMIRDAGGPLPGSEKPLPLSSFNSGSTDLHYEFPSEALADRSPVMQALTVFRGHEFGSSFLLKSAGGTTVDFRPYRYGPAQVTLLGRTRRRASIVFILDCSHSMTETTTVEGPTEETASRLDVARGALAGMLTELAEQGDARVGVRFYGHRVGWNTSKPDQMLRQTDYGRTIPESLTPAEDVELVLPLGRFDSVVAGGVLQLLPTLKPWGETPLYLALVQAEGDFAKDDPDTDKRIIVITDGNNYQFNARRPVGLNDVLTAAGERKVPIHIVGFGIAEKEAEQARREFTTLAERTGGSYVPATSATTLIRSLEVALGPSRFNVIDDRGREIGRANVGNAVSVRRGGQPLDYVGPLRHYTVALDSVATEIELSGGEAAELMLSRDGAGMVSARYDRGEPIFRPLTTGGASSGVIAGIHRPVWQDRGVRFPISLQREDNRFMPRPAEVWIEIAPPKTAPQAATSRYYFYDTNYEPQTPAPVQEWTALDWPAGIKQAEVRLWCKPQRTPTSHAVSLAAALSGSNSAQAAPVGGIRGVAYLVRGKAGATGEPYRVAIVERHGDDSAGLGSLKVELVPPADRTVHRFDAEHRLATHLFYLSDADEASLAGREIRFTTREALQSGAWQLEEPALVPIAAEADVIRLTP